MDHRILTYDTDDVTPGRMQDLDLAHADPSTEHFEFAAGVFGEVVEIFRSVVQPAGVVADISTAEFEHVYENDKNADDTPLKGIFPQASRLALFAFTLGEAVRDRIRALTGSNELPQACMLDAVASRSVDLAVARVERDMLASLPPTGDPDQPPRVLLYSPGYCGWHVTAQKRLFEFLRPEEIGITLNEICLMHPLKSVSGVVIGGPQRIHEFRNNFPFCKTCKGRTCRERIRFKA